MDRRTLLAGSAALVAAAAIARPALAHSPATRRFPPGFIWGAATAGHQVEGNDTASDTWLLQNIAPTVFAEPAGDAANSLHMWPVDLDLCVALGLNAYRFSVDQERRRHAGLYGCEN